MDPDMIRKIAKTAGGGEDPDLAKINAQSLKELTAEDVFTFKIAACDTLVDRDHEHFTPAVLADMAAAYVGKTVIFDHEWSAAGQTARIYDGYVEDFDGGSRLILLAYMLRTAGTQPVIDAIEGGILREVSVGCAVRKRICDICGNSVFDPACSHYPGRDYDGVICTVTLDDLADVYEVSFVPVPAQRAAGVTKQYAGKKEPAGEDPAEKQAIPQEALDELALEAVRYP